MKKLLYTIGFLMFASALIQPMVTFGQDGQFSGNEEDVPYSTARIFSKLVDEVGLNPDADWTTSFGDKEGDEEDVGQDLYATIYNKTENQPQQKANKDLAAKFALTEAELVRVLHADYTPLIEKKPGLTQEELQEKLSIIQQEYKATREIEELRANVKAVVETSEIFANGDVGDSGFDLINDLNIIEELLFLKTSPIDIGKAYSSSDGGNAPVGQAGGTQAASTGIGGNKKPVGSRSSPLQVDADNNESSDDSDDESVSSGSISDDEQLDPAQCFDDDGFSEALEEFEENSEVNSNYKNASVENGEVQSEQQEKDDDEDDKTGDEENIDQTSQALSSDGIQSAPADEWLKPSVCNDVFCLTVNVISEPVTSAYANSDNCIACHVEKINDVLKTVLNHSLVPTKAPGNLGESAECKKAVLDAFGLVNMNVYAIAMPVQTPPNDDLVYGTNIADEWRYFCEQTAFFPEESCKDPAETVEESEYLPPPILEDRAFKQSIAQTQDDVSQENVVTRVDNQVTAYKNASADKAKLLDLERKSNQSIGFATPLMYELDQMNFYFANFHLILRSLHQEVDELPGSPACTKLKEKGECK